MPTTEMLIWILTKRFRGYETSGTKLFEHFGGSSRGRILDGVTLVGDETPVVASIVSHDRWVLITTRRIIDRLPAKTVEIDVNAVTSAQSDFVIRAMKMDPVERRDDAAILRLKETAKEVQLTLASGDTYCLEVEPGDSYFGNYGDSALIDRARLGVRGLPHHVTQSAFWGQIRISKLAHCGRWCNAIT